jgi:GMP synthase-like glutamine amidotransferase
MQIMMPPETKLNSMITIFQHGEHESAGEIESYLLKVGAPFEIVRLYESNEISPAIPLNLIVLGGQMSVNNTKDYSHFADEKMIIRKMIGMNRPVLGICLGAQLIASAFGQKIYSCAPEIGWHKVVRCNDDPYFPEMCHVFHWHNETFNLPPNAKLVLQGGIVKNQAFRLGSALAVQFHPEVTMKIISHWEKDLPDHRRVQIEQETMKYLGEYSRHCHDLIDLFRKGWT